MAGRLPLAWGTTQAELDRAYPADAVLDGPVALATRAITIDAPPALVWRWVCQIAVAPYSYDWIDNLGRRSPQTLTPGADDVRVGQRLQIFELTSVEPGYQLTGRTLPGAERFFGRVALTYAVEPAGHGARLVCRLAVADRGLLARVWRELLTWGDLVMMRRQFLNLKELAERDAIALGH